MHAEGLRCERGTVWHVYVGIAKISLVIGDSHSLKDKRMVLRRIKDRVRDRVGVPVTEVGEHDIWQRSELGVRGRGGRAREGDRAARRRDPRRDGAAGGAQIAAIARDISTFAAESAPYAPVDDRTGAADKAQGQGDPDWIPEEWREGEP